MSALDRLRVEPALITEAVKAAVIVIAAALPSFSGDEQAAVVVVATGVFGLITALTTKPPQLAAISEFIQTVGVAILAFGVDVPADVLSALVVLSGVVVTLIQRSQVTPNDKVRGVKQPRALG